MLSDHIRQMMNEPSQKHV